MSVRATHGKHQYSKHHICDLAQKLNSFCLPG